MITYCTKNEYFFLKVKSHNYVRNLHALSKTELKIDICL